MWLRHRWVATCRHLLSGTVSSSLARTIRPTMGRSRLATLALGTSLGFSLCCFLFATTDWLPLLNLYGSEKVYPGNPGELRPGYEFGSSGANEYFHKVNDLVARQLALDVRVLCWVMTTPTNHESKARHVKATWGKRCNKLLFLSTLRDKSLGAVRIHMEEGAEFSWGKTVAALKYLYQHHMDEADWFLKADDNTYVVVENLRHMLSPHKSSDPIYVGCRFRPYDLPFSVEERDRSQLQGVGFVLSKRALELTVEEGLPNGTVCRDDGRGREDVEIEKCLRNVGVRLEDSRDGSGRGRSFPYFPDNFLTPSPANLDLLSWKYGYYRRECCSETAVSFHYVPPKQMYALEYLVYHLRPHGVGRPQPDRTGELPPTAHVSFKTGGLSDDARRQ